MKKADIQMTLPVTFLREGQRFVAYTPALDLSTAGDTFEQAQERFAEAVGIFFEECAAMGTLSEVLANLGWTRKEKAWLPPVVVAQESISFGIPAFA